MEPWYKFTTSRPEVCEGRSFNPDEFAVALKKEQNKTATLTFCVSRMPSRRSTLLRRATRSGC